MTSITKELDQLSQDCPLLNDDEFLRHYPGIDGVASFMNANARVFIAATGRYEPFDRLGVTSVREYLEHVQQGEQRAVEFYSTLKRILGF